MGECCTVTCDVTSYSHVAKSCIANTAHAALEITCFIESFADRIATLGAIEQNSKAPPHPSPSCKPSVAPGLSAVKMGPAPIPSLTETLACVSKCVSDILGTSVLPDEPLMEAGIDSLGASELQRAIGEEFSSEMPATLLFDHPSIAEITSVMSVS